MPLINRLVMQGFKSFAKRTELPFSNQFNIVIGPNGSGKSNILDGLCFVLGRLSSKDLRTEKMAHLIYNGGKARQPSAKGEVSIFFDNSGKILPYEDKTVKLSRIIKPSGQSVYKINDKTRTRQEILDMMALGKINPNGYNIVLQGDITRLVEMTSEERRQVIEEIAGIRIYEEKKKKTQAELERVETRIRETEIVLAEKKTHLRELRKDRDHAFKYKEMSDKIIRYKATHLHLQKKSKNAKKEGLDREIAGHRQEIEKIKSAIEKLKASAESKKKEIAEIDHEVEQKGAAEQKEMHRSAEQTRVDIATAKNRMSAISSEVAKACERREKLASDLNETDLKLADLASKSEELEKNRTSLTQEKDRLENEIRKIRGSGEDVSKLEMEITSLDKDAEKLQTEIENTSEKKQEILRNRDKAEMNLSSIEASMKKIAEIQKTRKSELEKLEETRKEFKHKTLQLNKFLSENSSTSASIGDIRRRIHNENEELAKTKTRLLASRERALGSNAVRSVLEQDSIKGIHGTVSQLGKVPSKYSTALETAAGKRINSIVVENDAVAARCISYLKQKKLGRATFLPLNKLRKPAARQKMPEENGSHGLAVDLVSFDSKYADVFSYVFGNTLVVDSINSARKIGIGKHRMVTLDGDLTDVSGAMYGGFRQKSAAAFNEGETDKTAKDIESRIARLESDISVLEKKKSEEEESITALREERAGLEGDIIRMEKGLHLESSDQDTSKKSKAEINSEMKKLDRELQSMQEKISGLQAKIGTVKTRKMKIREQISGLANPSVVAQLTAMEQTVAEKNEQIQSAQTETSSAKTESSILKQEKERNLQIMKQLSKEEKNFKAEQSELAKKTKSWNRQLSELQAKASKFEARHKSLFTKKNKLSESLQSDDENIIRKEERINTIEVKINNITVKASEIAGQLAGLSEEASQYSDAKLVQGISEEQLKADIYRFERSKNQMGNINMKALEVYDDAEKQYKELLKKKDTLSSEKNDVILIMNEIESNKKDLFMGTFNTLNEHFKEAFAQLSTKGSEAYLMIENPESPFEAGVRIRVKLAGDKFMDIRSLSGGEKTMTALAFIFSIQEHEPASFYIFDEVDAALDKKNSERFAQLVKKYSGKAQYIVISHNDNVITAANVLYGVSMDEHGMSNVVSMKT